MQVLWAVLQAYAEAEDAIQAALADTAAVKAAALKKLPPAKDAADPDEWLPVRAKCELGPALRYPKDSLQSGVSRPLLH